MIKNLLGKTCICTASTDGIGLAIAHRLGLQGANVVVSSRKESNIQRAVDTLKNDNINVIGVKCHVGHPKHRQRLFDETIKNFGAVDVLVSNAAVNPEMSPVLECNEHTWDRIFEVNVKSSWLLAKEVYPHLKARGGGSIVFISSIAAYQPFFSMIGAYSVSKTALLGLTKTISQEVASDNIRVNCVAPGIVQTKFSKVFYDDPEMKETFLNMIPMRRIATPEEIAGTVSFLVSDDAKYITGETICVTGGMPSRL